VPIDPEKLRQVVERVQVGDTEEGVEALTEFAEMVGSRPEHTRHAVRQELAELQISKANTDALEKFAKRYPKLRDEPLIVDAATRALRDEMAKDLKAAGLPDEELDQIREDVGRLGNLHGQARLVARDRVRSADDLLNDVGKTLSEKFNIKPASRDAREYVRDLRAQRGFKVDDDAAGARDGSRAPGSRSTATDQQDNRARHEEDRDRAYVAAMRRGRGYAA
jgi:hypothetical protein